MNDNAALAAEFDNEISANIAIGLLRNNGIDAWMPSNIMGTMYGAGATWAPSQVLVSEADLEKARQILHEHGDI
ncbi:MAG: DUF2007 domain-containing protein [Muribaculaceae bacterium]|nr:DUF2007 domain-containing protein [Muribaculaceae bacterium]